MFPLMGTGSVGAFGTGLIVFMALMGLAYGPVAAYLSEAFPTAYRYTGTGLTYNLGGVAGGGFALVVAPMLAGSGARNAGDRDLPCRDDADHRWVHAGPA